MHSWCHMIFPISKSRFPLRYDLSEVHHETNNYISYQKQNYLNQTVQTEWLAVSSQGLLFNLEESPPPELSFVLPVAPTVSAGRPGADCGGRTGAPHRMKDWSLMSLHFKCFLQVFLMISCRCFHFIYTLLIIVILFISIPFGQHLGYLFLHVDPSLMDLSILNIWPFFKRSPAGHLGF